MENKKYELVKDDFIIYKGKKLYRIVALKSLSGFNLLGHAIVHKGVLGGYVEGYHNLSQEGDCWIFDNAKVYGNARVKDSAAVGDDVEIYGNAVVKDKARVFDSAKIYGNAEIKDGANIYNNVEVFGNAVVCGFIEVEGAAKVLDNAAVRSVSSVYRIEGHLCDNARVYGISEIGIITTHRGKTSNNSIFYY